MTSNGSNKTLIQRLHQEERSREALVREAVARFETEWSTSAKSNLQRRNRSKSVSESTFQAGLQPFDPRRESDEDSGTASPSTPDSVAFDAEFAITAPSSASAATDGRNMDFERVLRSQETGTGARPRPSAPLFQPMPSHLSGPTSMFQPMPSHRPEPATRPTHLWKMSERSAATADGADPSSGSPGSRTSGASREASAQHDASEGRSHSPNLDDYREFTKLRSGRFYECFDLEQRVQSIQGSIRLLEGRPRVDRFISHSAELLRQVSNLHLAATHWYHLKQQSMQERGFNSLTPNLREELIAIERLRLQHAVCSRRARMVRYLELDDDQKKLEQMWAEIRFDQCNDP